MALPLKDSRAIADMAEILCDFLPGSGNSIWKGHVSFKTVAEKVGVGDFWQVGSKKPMITSLLSRTLEFKRDRFGPLVVEIVRAGLAYRQSKGNPIKPGDIDYLNGLILEIGFKFQDLWDPCLKASLKDDGITRASEHLEQEQQREKLHVAERDNRSSEIQSLKDEFLNMHADHDRQHAGLQLEKILNRLFALNDLSPRDPFRVTGEQIDGSFVLDHEIYLFEAKWTHQPSIEADLLVFRGKIEGKSKYTRGVFVSVNGITRDAEDAITRGKQPNLFIIDGYDITMLLQDDKNLQDFLRQRQRLLAEEGRIYVPFNDLQL